MFLTDKEIIELTGLKMGKKQCEYLSRHGWVFFVDAHGKPKVSVDYAKSKLGSKSESKDWDLKFA